MKRIAVIGASLAGLRAAEALRREGFDGELTLIGEEADAPYDRPPLSKQILRREWEPSRVALAGGDALAELALELRLAVRAERLDAARRRVVLSDGSELAYDGLVIATGARPRELGFGRELAGVRLLRTLPDALALRAELAQKPRVCVVGAGFIGLEVAASCRMLGLEVCAVEPLPLPLVNRLGEPMARALMELHRDHGVELRLGAGVSALEGGARVERVRLEDGSSVAADLVIVGIGVRPNSEWLIGSGIALGDGVLCDATCAASLPDVVAAGDVASWHNPRYGRSARVEHWSNAVEMASHAARRLLSGSSFAEPFAPVPYFWSDQYDVKLQVAGAVGGDCELAVVEQATAERKLVALFGREGRLCGVLCWNRPAQLARYRKLIAAGTSFPAALALARGAGSGSAPGA